MSQEGTIKEEIIAEEFIPVGDADDNSEVGNNNMLIDKDDLSESNNNNMELEAPPPEEQYEKKIPKPILELKKIFPDEFQFDSLKNLHGSTSVVMTMERDDDDSSTTSPPPPQPYENIEKVIVQEGEGLEAIPGSVIRYLEGCQVFFKRNEHSDWEVLTHSNTLLQENRLRLNRLPPVFIKCIHTMKLGEKAFFKIHKHIFPELKVTRLDPVQDDVENVDKKLLNVFDCFDYYAVQYISLTHLELKEVPKELESFEEHLEQINKKRLEGNVLFKEFAFTKALKAYNSGVVKIGEVKLLDGNKLNEQKRILKEERVKLLVNIAKCHTSLNNEKNHQKCLETCEKILYYDPENYTAHYLKAKTYNTMDDYSRGLECMEKANQFFNQKNNSNSTDPDQQKKDQELKQRMDIVEKQLLRKKKLQEEVDNKLMKSKMSNMFSEELYADTEPYDEEEYWRRQQEEDERLGRKPWFMSDGTIHYQQL